MNDILNKILNKILRKKEEEFTCFDTKPKTKEELNDIKNLIEKQTNKKIIRLQNVDLDTEFASIIRGLTEDGLYFMMYSYSDEDAFNDALNRVINSMNKSRGEAK